MAIDTTYYGSVDEANAYFAGRLYSQPWGEADPGDKPKALLAARRLIDNLNFKGHKHAVWVLHQQTPPPCAIRRSAPSIIMPRRLTTRRRGTRKPANRWSFPADRTPKCRKPFAGRNTNWPSRFWTGWTHKWSWRTWRSRPRATPRCGRTTSGTWCPSNTSSISCRIPWHGRS